MGKLDLKDYNQVLIVEGKGDLAFYAEVLEHLGKKVFIKEFGGKSNISTKLHLFLTPVLLKEKSHIAVVIDADNNPDGAFRSVKNAIEAITGQVVGAPGVWTDGNPRMGIFVVPDPCRTGEVETLVWEAWSADIANEPAKRCIEDYTEGMKRLGLEAQSCDKGFIGALLAICHDDDPRLGPATRAKVFDLEHPKLSALREFLSVF